MKKYILALDQGTTSSRAVLFDKNGENVCEEQIEFKQIFSGNGYVEHDPEDIWNSQIHAAENVLNKFGITYRSVDCIGISNQRETTVLWDKETGEPVCNAIVWQCRRTAELCEKLKKDGCTEMIREKTGLIIDPYFSATKIKWILDNVSGAAQKALEGRLLFGTVDTFLIWRLTKGEVHATDVTNASRTMLFNIHDMDWDDELLNLFGIPRSMLPRVLNSSDDFGKTSLLGGEIPICGVAGDQQASLFGQTCFDAGDVKCTYGTGAFILMNTGEKPAESKNGLISTVAWSIGGKAVYALEGSIFVAGAVIQWLRDGLKIIDNAAQSEEAALSVSDNGGVYFVPAFVGLGAPRWDPSARGLICGLTRAAERGHIARAALESIAYQADEVISLMENESGIELSSLRVDGGACQNNFLMQFQSDIRSCEVIRSGCVETTALGCAYLAGLKSGYWQDLGELRKNRKVERVFKPGISQCERESLKAGWRSAVERTLCK